MALSSFERAVCNYFVNNININAELVVYFANMFILFLYSNLADVFNILSSLFIGFFEVGFKSILLVCFVLDRNGMWQLKRATFELEVVFV